MRRVPRKPAPPRKRRVEANIYATRGPITVREDPADRNNRFHVSNVERLDTNMMYCPDCDKINTIPTRLFTVSDSKRKKFIYECPCCNQEIWYEEKGG